MENSQSLRMSQMLAVSSTLQVLKTDMTKPNLKDYFENYADIWKQKASLQYNKYTMVQDVHAPNELRVNQQLKTFLSFMRPTLRLRKETPCI